MHTHICTHTRTHTHTYTSHTYFSNLYETSVMEEMEICAEDTVSESPPPPSDKTTSSTTSPPSPHNHQDTTTTAAAVTRTADQVALSAKAAGLTNTTGPVQLLHFGAQLNSDEIKLLEVPSNVLQALKQGDK